MEALSIIFALLFLLSGVWLIVEQCQHLLDVEATLSGAVSRNILPAQCGLDILHFSRQVDQSMLVSSIRGLRLVSICFQTSTGFLAVVSDKSWCAGTVDFFLEKKLGKELRPTSHHDWVSPGGTVKDRLFSHDYSPV